MTEPPPRTNNPDNGRDDRPPQIRAMGLATQVVSACLTPVLPPGLGYWLDLRWGTAPWLLVAGIVFGGLAGIAQFRNLLKAISAEEHNDSGE